MPTSLFRRKAVEACQADADDSEHRLKRSLGVFSLTALGIGAVIGAGIFSSPGTAAAGGGVARGGRPGAGPLVHPGGAGLRLRGALLRGDGLDGAGGRERLHLRLRDPGRVRGLDHRLGPHPRVRGRQRRGGRQLGGLLQDAPGRAGAPPPGLAVHHPGPCPADAGAARRGAARARHPHRPEPAGGAHRGAAHRAAGARHPGERAGEHRHGAAQAGHGGGLHRGGRVLHPARELDALRSQRAHRHPQRRLAHLLRLHRLRRRLHHRRGGAESAAGHPPGDDRHARASAPSSTRR